MIQSLCLWCPVLRLQREERALLLVAGTLVEGAEMGNGARKDAQLKEGVVHGRRTTGSESSEDKRSEAGERVKSSKK